MSAMVERVAKAMEFVMIERASIKCTSRDHSMALARAAIEAMREPTEAIWDAGSITSEKIEEEGLHGHEDEITMIWQAMIDEALK